MKVINNEYRGFSDVITLNAADIRAIGNGGTKIIATIPVGGAVELCGVIETVAIATSTSLVIDVGTTIGDPDEFIDNLDVDAMTTGLPTYNTGDVMVKGAATTTFLGGALPVKPVSAATPVYIKVTDAAIADVTAGQIVIGLRILDLKALV
jgi:hypothetical protein